MSLVKVDVLENSFNTNFLEVIIPVFKLVLG